MYSRYHLRSLQRTLRDTSRGHSFQNREASEWKNLNLVRLPGHNLIVDKKDKRTVAIVRMAAMADSPATDGQTGNQIDPEVFFVEFLALCLDYGITPLVEGIWMNCDYVLDNTF
jgi:hypothetical protein